MSKPAHFTLDRSRRLRFRPRIFASAPLLLILASCRGEDGASGASGTTCTIEAVEGQDTLVCSDGTSAPIGGEPGDDGTDAEECTVSSNGDGSYDLTCPGADPITLTNSPAGKLLIESDYEVPGETCTNGGQILRIGYDADDDGTLDEDEVTQTEIICQGNVTLASQQDVDDFAGVNGVTGFLTIEGADITDLTPLGELRFVGLDLSIEELSATTLDGLDNLKSIGEDLWLSGNASLTDISAFSGLTKLPGWLGLWENDALTDLAGLNNIESIAGTLYLDNNDALTSLDGLSGLQTIGGEGFFWANDVLEDLTGLSNLTEVGEGFHIEDNDALTSLDGLSGIEEVPNDLRLIGNDALTDLSALENLVSIGEDLLVVENASLQSLAAFANLTSVGGDFDVRDNPSLPTCEAEWLEDNLETIGGTSTISGNDDAGTCN